MNYANCAKLEYLDVFTVLSIHFTEM